jgi:hypothetical protein
MNNSIPNLKKLMISILFLIAQPRLKLVKRQIARFSLVAFVPHFLQPLIKLCLRIPAFIFQPINHPLPPGAILFFVALSVSPATLQTLFAHPRSRNIFVSEGVGTSPVTRHPAERLHNLFRSFCQPFRYSVFKVQYRQKFFLTAFLYFAIM